MKNVIKEDGAVPIKIWTDDIEDGAVQQLKNLARLPFISRNGVAAMADAHMGIGSTVGSVIATDAAIIPASVGVDIGCGMVAVRLSLKASDLPDSLTTLRHQIERDIPLGAGGRHQNKSQLERNAPKVPGIDSEAAHNAITAVFGETSRAFEKALHQLGTLGSGNHFIELCIDESDDVWVMLHSGSRGVGNMIGTKYIEIAKREMEKWHIALPDGNLAYLPEGSEHFDDYMAAVQWAQDFALENRKMMLRVVLEAMRRHISKDFSVTEEAINCHHNYVAKENHFGRNLWVTRKGAIRARDGDLGIIPGSMGQQSYIVRGKGNLESYCSCSHGAGRKMSRTAARKAFTVSDLIEQTQGVDCRKDDAVLDEIPASYKDIDVVMANQKDLVEVVHRLKQIMNIKGA